MADLANKSTSESAVDERMRKFGEYLRAKRKEARYSLGELATELRKRGASKHGTSRQYLGMLEKGKVTNPSLGLLIALAKTLDIMSNEYWLLAGHVPPGPEGEAIAELVREANRKGFSRMLKDEGLSDEMIENVLSKVSNETIDRVFRREEPLVIQDSVTPDEWAEHQAQGFETHTIDTPGTLSAREPAGDYLDSVKDEFKQHSSGPGGRALFVGAKRKGRRIIPRRC